MRIGFQRSRWLQLATGMAAALLLAACHTAPAPPKLDPEQMRQFEARGYPATRELEVVASEELRTASEVAMRWVWLRPVDGERHPLLIYLPGAGQDAQANEPWRRAIARAGYAVLSWQALPDDEQRPAVSRSTTAGAASTGGVDLHDWAATRFDGPHLQQRSRLLAGLMDELRRAAAANEPALRGVDLDHVALAGYELGAQTLMLQAGEQVRGVEAPHSPPPFQAYLAISPQASFDQGSFERRFREVHGPVLTLTSDNDQDPYSLGSAAYLRKAPYVSMPAGGKYLAVWRGLSHAELGGPAGHPEGRSEGLARDGAMPKADDASGNPGSDDGASSRGGDSSGSAGNGSPSGGHRGGRRGRGGSGGDANARPGGATQAGTGNAARGGASPTARAMQASAMATVSIAFLDAELRDDKLARDWLDRDCERWLKPIMAEWSHK